MATATPLKIATIALATIALILTLVSLFTPSWRYYQHERDVPSFGVISYDCDDARHGLIRDECDTWWNHRHTFENVVVFFLIIAVIAEVLTLITACATLKARPSLWNVVPILALVAALCLLIAFVVYAFNYTDYDGRRVAAVAVAVTTAAPAVPQRPVAAVARTEFYASNYLSWSFWLAVIAFILMLLSMIMGFVASKKHATEHRKHEVTYRQPVVRDDQNVARVVVQRDVRYESDQPGADVRRY